jgi:endonuclease IV
VSGSPIHEEDGYADTFDTFDREVGLEHLRAFHLNDSLAEFDSKRDRHAKIGTGKLGLEPFGWLLNDKRFAQHPGYLETPVDEESEYAMELGTLRKLLKK